MTVRRRRSAPRRRDAPRWDAEDWEQANTILLARCGWRCEKCGKPIVNSVQRHHRVKRTAGGDRLSNILMLHEGCHQWVHAHPEEAFENGWIVTGYEGDPLQAPVLIGGFWYLLDDEGGRIRVDGNGPTPAIPC